MGDPAEWLNVRKPPVCCRVFSRRTGIWLGFKGSMAKSNCPAEDSAPPQASAGQLTPRFLSLSLTIRLLQVTVAISPSAAKGASKGRFSGRIRSEGPRRQMRDFERWMKGELRWRSGKFYQAEGAADFRERVSRSIWPSKLCLSTTIYLWLIPLTASKELPILLLKLLE